MNDNSESGRESAIVLAMIKDDARGEFQAESGVLLI